MAAMVTGGPAAIRTRRRGRVVSSGEGGVVAICPRGISSIYARVIVFIFVLVRAASVAPRALAAKSAAEAAHAAAGSADSDGGTGRKFTQRRRRMSTVAC